MIRKVFIIFLFFLMVSCTTYSTYMNITLDSGFSKDMGNYLYALDISVTGEPTKKNYILFNRDIQDNIDNVYFTIQYLNKPINRNFEFIIDKVKIKNSRTTIESETYEIEFSSVWYFENTYDNRVLYYDKNKEPQIRISKLNREIYYFGYHSNNINLGSFDVSFDFSQSIKKDKDLEIEFFYRIGDGNTQSILCKFVSMDIFTKSNSYPY